ncbi:MAG: response regulator [Myxococcota bacterium]|jgi:FixJ family two-component response regulator|nr:response regulator [Myxococcota bacterium]
MVAEEEREPIAFIVDDDEGVRQSIRRLFDEVSMPALEFGSANDFLEAYDPDQPGCLLLDIRMPGMSGTELQRTLLEREIFLPIIFITGHADVALAVECMKLGAFDLIEKPFRAQRLLDTVHQAMAKDREDRALRTWVAEAKRRFSLLTNREREVVDLAVTGLTNREISEELGITSQAIDAHRSKAMWKVGVMRVTDLVRLSDLANR